MITLTWTTKEGVNSVLYFDAEVREEYVLGSDVTTHPVELGANISDHVRPRLKELIVEGVITNTPLTNNDANGKATRVGFKIDGDKKVRIAKTTGDVI